MMMRLLPVAVALLWQLSLAQPSITDVLNSETTASPGAAAASAAAAPAAAGSAQQGMQQNTSQATVGQQIGTLLNTLGTAAGGANGTLPVAGSAPAAGTAATTAPDDFSKVSVTASSRDIVSGMVEAFMNKVQLQQGEKECLENNLGNSASSVMGIGRDAVNAVKEFMRGGNSSHLPLVPLVTDAAMKVTSLVATSTGLLKNCVQGDALEMLNRMGHNLANWTYISNRLVVSGVDVAHCFADSIISFEEKNFKKFGADVGTALRKMLLSNSTNGTRLPEGYPKEAIIGDVTDGLMTGFFAEGTTVRVVDKDPNDAKVDITVDLHKCISDNQQVFRAAWKGIWDLIASIAANKEQHLEGENPGQKWTGELMVAMVGIPGALATCGIDQATEKMMIDAVKALRHLSVSWTFPNDQIKAATGTEKVAKAVEAWTSNDFKTFGIELGKLLREFVLLAFPSKYSVDPNGRLQANLMSENLGDRLGHAAFFPPLLLAGVALLVLSGLALVVRRKFRTPVPEEQEVEEDLEGVE